MASILKALKKIFEPLIKKRNLLYAFLTFPVNMQASL